MVGSPYQTCENRADDLLYMKKLHPQMIGRASRIGMLGELISYMQSQGAWITTCEEVARYVLKHGGDKK